MAFKLPPLSSVRVFEAAARHGSFKKAAEELNITASAVSHAVQNLEDWLGVELFRRGGGKLDLTEPGAAYGSVLGEALKTIADATARLPGRRARGRLTINSAPGFAARWLLPRLSRFTQRFPDISVDIQTSLDRVDLPMEGIDAAIRLAPAGQAMAHWTHLLAESLVPVCAPALRKRHAELSSIELIATAELIHLTSTSADWAEWFRIVGVEAPDTLRGGLRVDTMHMAFEAACRGFGIALGRAPLFEVEIETGRLVRLFDDSVPSGLSYWLVTMEADFQSQDVKIFRQWLLEELGTARREGGKQHKPRKSGAATRDHSAA
jgi:LysR family transcriptional regulator, glycine cleavage system transcriptional activator